MDDSEVYVEVTEAPQPLTATPWRYRDPATIPRREFVGGWPRKKLSLLVAPGGTGKSALTIAQAIEVASGRTLLGDHDGEPAGVWMINLEDDADELDRRVAATMAHYRVPPERVEDRLFLDCPETLRREFKLARQADREIVPNEPLAKELIAEIMARDVCFVVIDPLVSAHEVPENDNSGVDRVAKLLAAVADQTDSAVLAVHHTRKLNGMAADVDSIRGGGALVAAARSARVLQRMTKDEAERFGIDVETAWRHVAMDDAKSNLRPLGKRRWRHLVTVALPNGDEVGVVEPWTPPEMFDGVHEKDIDRLHAAMAGKAWRARHTADEWVGIAIAGVVGIDLGTKHGRAKTRAIQAQWTQSGWLEEYKDLDHRRMEKLFVRPAKPEWACTTAPAEPEQ
jgi:hypothetical protein